MGSMELISHACTMELSANHFLYAGAVGAGALASPVMYLNFPLLQITILID